MTQKNSNKKLLKNSKKKFCLSVRTVYKIIGKQIIMACKGRIFFSLVFVTCYIQYFWSSEIIYHISWSSKPYYLQVHTVNEVGKIFVAHICHFFYFYWKFSMLTFQWKSQNWQMWNENNFPTKLIIWTIRKYGFKD